MESDRNATPAIPTRRADSTTPAVSTALAAFDVPVAYRLVSHAEQAHTTQVLHPDTHAAGSVETSGPAVPTPPAARGSNTRSEP
ncbi:hypothetical protein QM012_003295 [Aureobasidium pullulans]|uniref:Uncharacterized protein n=1 Tax=Aureobasidium pullulans TaxID=5580 RepID=A0ABR0T801_AURPU